MRRIEKASMAFVLAGVLGMAGITGITSAQQNSNQNGNSNSKRGNRNNNSNMNMNSNMDMGMNSNMSINSNMSMGENMNSNMGGGMMSNASDSDFANMAAMGGQAEIQMAQIAIERAKDKDVMKYAKKMVKDHTKAGKDLDKIAAQKSMTLSKTPNAEQMEMMNQLRQASDSEFDMTYVRLAGVQAHQTMETLFQNEANSGSDPMLKSFASKTLPVVQMHLKMAQDKSNGGMGGTMNSSKDMNSNTNKNKNGNTNSNSSSNSNR